MAAEATTTASVTPSGSPALRVCAVLPSGTRGGAELWQERLDDAGTRIDLEVVVLADGPAARAWRERGTPVTVVRAGRRAKGAATAVVELTRHLRASRPDVALAHGVKAGLLTALAGHLAGTRVVWMRHDNSFPGWPLTLLDALTDGSVAATAHLLQGRRPGGIVIEPPLGGAPLPRAEACAALGLPDATGPLRLVMASRLVPYKGMDDALRAIAGVPAWELHVYGIPDDSCPDEADRLRHLADTLGVRERLHLHPPVEDLGTHLAAFDAVALLTRHEPGAHVTGEAFGMSAHEGLAAGVPVIAVPPVSESIGAGGLEVPPADPGAVMEALTRLSDPDQRALLSSARRGDERIQRGAAQAAERLETHLASVSHRPGAGMTPHHPISVVTTVLNEADGLEQLLSDLRPQLADDDELVVVDGGSADATLSVARAHAASDRRVTVIEAPGAGISAGRNIGISAAAHETIACTDVGCEPSPLWLAALRAAAAEHPQALLTGVYDVARSSPLQSALAVTGYPQVSELTHPTPITRGHGRAFGRAFEASMPTGRSVAFDRAAWREVGGFPEHLATGEDVTFGRAVAARRPALLVADASVTWEQRPTLRSTLRMYYRYGLGSGHSGDRRLLARDGLRLVGYLAGGAMLARGGPLARGAALTGAAAYLSVPLMRASREPRALQVAALVPVVSALRDGAKVAGAIVGLREGPPEPEG